jgi:hypothetical protein
MIPLPDRLQLFAREIVTARGRLPVAATLRPSVNGSQRIRFAPGVRTKTVRDGRRDIRLESAEDSTVRLRVQAGHSYHILFEQVRGSAGL